MFLLIFVRLVLISRSDLVDLTTFPSACSSWAIKQGCTRIALQVDECTRPEKIPAEFPSIVLQPSATVPKAIRQCVLAIPSAEIIYSSTDSTYMHATIQSFFFGFWDDFYVTTLLDANKNIIIITQSQQSRKLRLQ